MSAPVRAARTAAFGVLRPLYRRRFARASTPAELVRLVRRTVPGSTHQIPEEIEAFLARARATRPERVCEVGTAMGGTTVLLARMAPTVRTMIGIDLRIANRPFVEGLVNAGAEVHLIEASSLERETVERVERVLAGAPLDVLFIDGSHEYEDVKQDFLLYRRFVRPGGLIAFHDIVEDYGERFGRPSGYWAGGVPRFWRELRDRYPSQEFVRDPEQDAFGIGVIEYDPAVEPAAP